jgi:hypothetical protein
MQSRGDHYNHWAWLSGGMQTSARLPPVLRHVQALWVTTDSNRTRALKGRLVGCMSPLEFDTLSTLNLESRWLSFAHRKALRLQQYQLPDQFSKQPLRPLVTLLHLQSTSKAPINKMLDLVKLSAAELQRLQIEGSLTAVELATQCLKQIEKYDTRGPKLRATIAVAPEDKILEGAAFLDEERMAGRLLGPLHGIPIIVKVVSSWLMRRKLRLTNRQDIINTHPDLGNAFHPRFMGFGEIPK